MAVFMNEGEIDHAVEVFRERAPELLPYVQYLADWRDVVNENSDGWPYWQAGRKAADRLVALVSKGMDAIRGSGEMPEASEMAKALAPIKSAATRFNLPKPEFKEAEAAALRM